MNFEEIWNKQYDLNKRIIDGKYITGTWGIMCLGGDDAWVEEARVEWMLNFNRAQIHESIELENSLNWKWWKDEKTDWENVKIELIDELHFLIAKMQVACMTPEEIYDLYMKKNALNHHRQDVGYNENYEKVKEGIEDNKRIDEILGGK